MKNRGYYLTFAEQWDDEDAVLTLRHETPNRNRRVRVLIRLKWLASLLRRWGR